MNLASTRTDDHKEMIKVNGTNLKFMRTVSKISQQKLADKLKVTFQQIGKYENGKNQLSAWRLYECTKIFGVPFEAFFDKDYIKKMHSVHSSLIFKKNYEKPKNFLNVYRTLKDIEDQMDAAEIQGKTPQDAGYLKPQADIASMEEINGENN